MNIFKRILGRETRDDSQAEITPEVSAELLRALVGNEDMTAEKAMEIPAFSAAVDFISSTVAMLPVKLFGENTEEQSTEEITDDPRLSLLNDEVNSVMTAVQARAAQIRDMLIYGSGFLYINQNRYGQIQSLHYVKHGDVSVQTNAHPIFRDFNIYVGGRVFPPFYFVILARNSPDGVTGIGAVEEHKTLLSAMYFTMKYEAVISKTGGNKKGFLQSEHNLSDSAMDKLKRVWRDLYANNENNMMVLNNGVKYVPSASTSVEMQLNENKRTNSEQIAQIFGLSMNVLSGCCSTAEYMSAVRTAVLPIVEQVQAALNQSLLTEEEKGGKYFVLDTSELLKGDTLSRYQAYEIALRNNFLQLDEVRYLEDRKPIGFDFLKLGLQDVLLDPKTGQIYTPNMNAMTRLGDNSLTQDDIRAIMDHRGKTNWIKGAHGYFAGSYPQGGGGSGGKGVNNLTKCKTSDIIKLRVNLFDRSDPIYLDSFSIEEEAGFEDVCIHGNSKSVQRIVDGKPVNMSAEEFAAFLKESTTYHGGDIRLASCSAGQGENSFAQQLSKVLGITVKAPDDDVYYAPDEGVLFVGSPYANTGRWRVFKNGDEVL